MRRRSAAQPRLSPARTLLAAFAASAALLWIAPTPAQVVVEEIGALQDSLAKAQQAFQSYQFAPAITILDPLLDTLSRWETAGRLQPADEALMEQALELRASCAFNLGKVDQCRQDFTRLVQLRPDYVLSQTKTPKIQRLFEEIRTSLTGTLSLQVDPPGSAVTLDGRALAGGLPPTLPVLKGLHLLRATHPGYDPEEKEVSVEVGQSVPVSLSLSPNARTIYFFVQPQGCQLLVDGKAVGSADAAASTQPDWSQYVQEAGADPAAFFVVAATYLPPGDHKVTLAKMCYQKREFVITVTLPKSGGTPGFVKPLALERRVVDLSVESHPTNSEVLIDGASLGTTPLRRTNFCIGEHEFVVRKPGVGEYRAKLTVPGDGPFQLEATLRPSLLWVGFTRDQDVTPAQVEAAQKALEGSLDKLRRFNGLLTQEKDPLLPDTFFTQGVGSQERSTQARELCDRYACQAILSGKLSSPSGKLKVELRLLVPGLPGEDQTAKLVDGPAAAPRALEDLDKPVFETAPEQVFSLADLPGSKGPIFLRDVGDPQGPDPGDMLLGVDRTITATAGEAYAALKASPRAVLRFLHGGQEKLWTFNEDPAGGILCYRGLYFGYRRAWLLSKQALLGAEAPEERLTASMNLASCELSIGRPEQALAALQGLTAQPGGVVSPSALAYLKAVALAQLGRGDEARQSLLAASQDATASLDGYGAVLIQPLATDLLRQLPAAPPSLPPEPGKGGA